VPIKRTKDTIDVADIGVIRVCIHHESHSCLRVLSKTEFISELTEVKDPGLSKKKESVVRRKSFA